jgi:hypothetical protein
MPHSLNPAPCHSFFYDRVFLFLPSGLFSSDTWCMRSACDFLAALAPTVGRPRPSHVGSRMTTNLLETHDCAWHAHCSAVLFLCVAQGLVRGFLNQAAHVIVVQGGGVMQVECGVTCTVCLIIKCVHKLALLFCLMRTASCINNHLLQRWLDAFRFSQLVLCNTFF